MIKNVIKIKILEEKNIKKWLTEKPPCEDTKTLYLFVL